MKWTDDCGTVYYGILTKCIVYSGEVNERIHDPTHPVILTFLQRSTLVQHDSSKTLPGV